MLVLPADFQCHVLYTVCVSVNDAGAVEVELIYR